MKNKTKIFALLLIVVTLAACNKYEEGPMISLRKVETRVAQDFELVEFTKDGVDMTQELADSVGKEWNFLTAIQDQNLITLTSSYLSYYGSFSITTDKKNIEMYIYSTGNINVDYIGMDPFGKYNILTWKIERLTKDEMWLSCTYNNSDYYLKLSNYLKLKR